MATFSSSFFTLLPILCLTWITLTFSAQPNPPKWPSSVYILDASDMDQVRSIVSKAATNTQFSPNRYALMFKPGNYKGLNITVSYYTSVIGMGLSPSDTKISDVSSVNFGGSALDNFWRSVENIYTKPTISWNGHVTMLWAVSQAAPLRRVFVEGNLDLWEGQGYSSGGYMSDSYITGTVTAGSQQQFYFRNVNMSTFKPGAWNMVFQGCVHAPNTTCGGVYTNIAKTPVIAEKPFIHALSNGSFQLVIPRARYESAGTCFMHNKSSACENDVVDFRDVYVTDPAKDTADTINAFIESRDVAYVVISAGVYRLMSSILVTKSNSVILGIGFPTLTSGNRYAAIEVAAGVSGVRIGGLLIEAGTVGQRQTQPLLKFGEVAGTSKESFLYDLSVRVGGDTDSNAVDVSATTMVEINTDNVVIDNAWLWRADHDENGIVNASANYVAHGLVVNGANVTTYGLAVEHTLGDLVQWNGNHGRCYFYQSELPYDVSQNNFGSHDYVGFRVGGTVTDFQGYGMGVYSFFRDYNVTVKNAIECPRNQPGIKFMNVFTRYLDGNGNISHVINGMGEVADKTDPGPQRLCSY